MLPHQKPFNHWHFASLYFDSIQLEIKFRIKRAVWRRNINVLSATTDDPWPQSQSLSDLMSVRVTETDNYTHFISFESEQGVIFVLYLKSALLYELNSVRWWDELFGEIREDVRTQNKRIVQFSAFNHMRFVSFTASELAVYIVRKRETRRNSKWKKSWSLHWIVSVGNTSLD